MNVTAKCPAKINEFLAVGTKDDSGYHPIRTIYQTINLYDILTVSDGAHQDELHCNWPLPESNTITKALNLVREYRAVPPLTIGLQKEIPMQAGLGGGSSDAAGLLSVINRFLEVPLAPKDLNEIAFAVGADVPFFLLGGRAKGVGYGETLTVLPKIPSRWLLLLQPAVRCSTAEMYAMLDYLDYPFLDFPKDDLLYNDFTRVAPWECTRCLDQLLSLTNGQASLTGSGSACFGFFGSCNECEKAERLFRAQGVPWIWVGQTL